jgi:plasmid stabilization system protein ParE
MKIVFSDRSRARLHEIQGYIAFHNIRAAEKVVDRIGPAVDVTGDNFEDAVVG